MHFDSSDLVVVLCSLLAGMLGSYLVFRSLTARAGQGAESPPREVAVEGASAGHEPQRAAAPARPAGSASAHAGSTELFVSACPQHNDAPGTWTCRFCKRDYCEACRRFVGKLAVCPSRACREVAERQASAGGARTGAAR